jgi:hypothetical protein
MTGVKSGPTFLGASCQAGWTVKTKLQSWAVPVIVVISVVGLAFVILVLVLAYRYRRQREPNAYRTV